MKIEKINDNQIRCTLTREDLADRELKLSELAYGTDKAKSLFRDMMQQAAFEFGFEADNIPLMIEAIPLSPDCIILIITKVDDPEELDTRFSKFAPTVPEDSGDDSSPIIEGADDILGLFKKLYETKAGELSKELESSQETKNKKDTKEVLNNYTRLYTFHSLDSVIMVSQVLREFYEGYNSLYKDDKTGDYMLVISKSNHSPEEFNKICNILSEYGNVSTYTNATESYLREHFITVIHQQAIQHLAVI
ncbi:MAG TPA: adaptor protein MecA [Candidatus Merdenecus merdavium]|nr:adaptor protein MecA [Candidatus Merdenecus merdavium]